MKLKICLLTLASLLMFGWNASPKNETADQKSWMPQDTSWKHLSLREKIGQTMVMRTNPEEEMEIGKGSYKTLFEKYPVGGFFVANWLLSRNTKPDSMASVIRQMIKTYSENSKIPLVFQEDYESGVGSNVNGMSKMPNLMAVGATGDTNLAYNYEKTIASEVRSLGFNWLLHPVADLNMNPLNSLVTTRSISDDPGLAIKMLKQQIKAMHQLGVAATIKHFPGDGVDYRDQHMITTENSLPMEVWWKKHGRVFQELINAGADAVMLGHIRLPQYQKEKIDGFFPPATLSKELIMDLLKGTMGFRGVVISDALEMGGFQQYYPDRVSSQVACFAAGTDVLLWPDYAYMDSLEAKIKRNEIPISRLDDAVCRVWALKERLGILKKDYRQFQELPAGSKEFGASTAKEIAERAVTLVANRKNCIPIKPAKGKRILFQIVTPDFSRHAEMENFKTTFKALEDLGFILDTEFVSQNQNASLSETDKYDKMIYAFVRSPFNPFSSKILNDTEAYMVWLISSLPPEKLITISYGDPYVHLRYFERAGASVNAYSNDPQTQLAVVKAITGQIPFRGKSPIILHDIAPEKN